jgi:uncharacterized membrane protein YbhN (UPF0104 family)
MGRTAGWARLLGGAAVLAVLLWQLGAGPFLHGLRTVRCWPVLAAVAITAGTTVCAALRWRLVARGLGVQLTLPAAIAYYYRSQFLNSALPGGVLGDVHRGLRQGRAAGDLARGLRAVVWDRAFGQVVQAVLVLVVLAAFASPVRSVLPLIAAGLLLVAGLLFATLATGRLAGSSRLARAIRTVRADLAALRRPSGLLIALSSAAVVAGHTGIFLIAARTAGTRGSPATLLPLAMLVLLAMTIPLSLGGWGPREGVAAWAFGAAGLGMNQGVAAATVYGVMAFVATLPGAVVLALGLLGRPDHRQQRPVEQPVPVSVTDG